jgi:hypothetical protein
MHEIEAEIVVKKEQLDAFNDAVLALYESEDELVR